jgi:hypothetical protein
MKLFVYFHGKCAKLECCGCDHNFDVCVPYPNSDHDILGEPFVVKTHHQSIIVRR